jgi:hypothetical protein
VLPLSTKRLRVELRTDHVLAVRVGRGWPGEAPEAERIVCTAAASGAGWRSHVQTLGQWLDQEKVAAMDVTFGLSDHFVRYAHIPWSDHVKTAAELAALGCATFEALYGKMAAEWEVRVDVNEHGKTGLACAIERGLLQALRELCGMRRLHLAGLRPHFMDVFNLHRRQIGGDGVLMVIESDRCVLASFEGENWRSVRSLPCGPEGAAMLATLIERERLLQGVSAQAPTYFDSVDGAFLTAARSLDKVVVLARVAS